VRITFDDGGYLEFQRSKKLHHVFVVVAARKPDNPLELLINSAEVHLSKLLEGVKTVTGPLILEGKINEQDNSNNNSENQ
jgi:hypothetical protein